MKLFAIAVILMLTTLLSGCASDSNYDRGPNGYRTGASNAHPAAYLTDAFQVNRAFPQHKAGPAVEFYFKKCAMDGENWPYSRTNYDCSYP